MAAKTVCLADFDPIKNNLKTGRKKQITALHKLVFEEEGDRQNRRRLREFQGFSFVVNDVAYEKKCVYVEENLTEADLMSICIMLGLKYDEEDLAVHIIKNLCSTSLLHDIDDDDNDDDDDDGDDDEGNDDDREITIFNTGGRDEEEAEAARINDDVTVIANAARPRTSVNGRSTTQSSKHSMRTSSNDRQNRNGDAGRQRGNVGVNNNVPTPRFALNFRDIEDSLPKFDGKTSMSVKDWVQEFEETSAMMYWDQLQMLVFAKKSLTGLAKQFVAGEKGLSTWSKLKAALLSEFELRVNSRQIHQRLTERVMKKDEGVMQYLYAMKDIAAEGKIVEKDLILYVIDGIKDLDLNKQMLYGARDLKDFKEKIRDYEEYMSKNQKVSENRNSEAKQGEYDKRIGAKKISSAKGKPEESAIKCYNCGEKGHKSVACKNKNKGTKCFNCNGFGHLAKDCRGREEDSQRKEIRYMTAKEDHMIVQVVIRSQEMSALIDTGSHVNVMKNYVYQQLQLTGMTTTHILLSGFGRNNERMKPMGSVSVDVRINDDVFNLLFYVVPNGYMRDGIIIGAPICKQAEITVNPDGVTIKRWEVQEMMKIESHSSVDVSYEIGDMASPEARSAKQEIVSNYNPVAKKKTNVSMKIVLTDETPVASGPRRLPFCERQGVEAQINEWLEDGIIEESEAEFSSPIVLVKKKDGNKRLCVDYRGINKVIVRDRFPLPLIEDQLDRLQDATVFSTIDLKNGFFHVPVEKNSRKYTAFVTCNGQYQFKKVPFGLANSPAVFQRFVNTIFRELTQKGIAMPYVDDVIIPAKDEHDALINLKEVLTLAQDYGLNLNWKKCQFMKRRIEFLGHVIENGKISPSPTKMKAVMNYPVPRTLKQVESFLGLAGYFRKFIPEFAKEAKPLSDLKKKDSKFIMGQAQLVSFEALKRKLCEHPVLKIFNQHHETELHTDASADGYGAVLLQRLPEDGQLHPVYYMSRKTSELERKYTSYELEILAVVEALKKFRVYLLGMQFKVITDCNAFAKTMAKKDLSTRVARWLLLLQEYNYVVEHRAGTQMRHVDALSRCTVMTIEAENILGKISRVQQDDEDLKAIFAVLQQKESFNGYYVKSKILYKMVNDKELIVLPKGLQYEILKKTHEKGHFGSKKMKELVKDEYYIQNIDERIQRVLANCIECIMVNRKKGRQEGELNPLPKHDAPLHTYHVDHLGPLESTHKMFKHIFVVIDGFTKFCWLYPTKSTTAKEVITKLQVQSAVFGNPEMIISDRGTAFTADEFQVYCREENIKHHCVTTGLPRANGQVERLNSTIIAVLAKLSIQDPSKWYKWVSGVQQVINATYHRSIGTTPFELLIGKPMRTKEDVQIKSAVEEQMRVEYDNMREELRQSAKQNILQVQEENKKTYNLRRRSANKYQVGERVAIKRTQLGGGLKLKSKYLGPYKVLEVKPNNTYNVTRVGDTEGPRNTTTCAEYMKKWPNDDPREAQGTPGWPKCGN